MFGFGIKCRRIKRLLSDRQDMPLPAGDEAKVLAHLSQCPSCREEMAFYSQLKKNAASLDLKNPPHYLWERITLQLDEHPWGSDDARRGRFYQRIIPGCLNFRGINIPTAFASIILMAILFLFPGHEEVTSDTPISESAHAHEYNANLEYLSLYMITNHDIFPDQVREYYMAQLEALEGKIQMIKSALERFPDNRRIRAQLAAAYAHKLAVYRSIGAANSDLIDNEERDLHIKRGDFYD